MTQLLKKPIVLACMLAALTLASGPAWARGSGGGPQGPPPQEAYDACEGKCEGDTASFESPRGDTVTGTCVTDRDGEKLVLRPDNHPEKRGAGGRDN